MNIAKVKLMGIVIALSSILLSMANTSTAMTFQSSEAIDDFVNKQMNITNIPGLSLGIVKNDQIVYLKGYGKADETNRLVTPQTPFIIGSVSKTFTALAVRQLVNEGKIELDRPVRDYISWFQVSDIDASKQITIRNLLDHKSGIPRMADYQYELYNDRYNMVQAVQMLKSVKLNRPVGVLYEYANVNYIILGLVIQNVSGLSYEEYVKNSIFDPLQMKNSFCSETAALNDGLAEGYQLYFGFQLPRHVPYAKAAISAGYLISSSEDMTHYLVTYLNNGNFRGSNITKEPDRSGKVDQETSGNDTYMDIYWNPRSGIVPNGYIEHAGADFNYSSEIIVLPKEKWGVVVLANTNLGTLSTSTISPVSIAMGIIKQFLVPQEYQPATNDNKKVYFVLDFVMLLILLLLSIQIRNFIKKRNTFFRSRISLFKFWIVLIVVNFVFPLGILFGLPRIFTNNENPSWALITFGTPDIGYFCIAVSGLFLAMGILKTIHLLVNNKNTNNIYKNPHV